MRKVGLPPKISAAARERHLFVVTVCSVTGDYSTQTESSQMLTKSHLNYCRRVILQLYYDVYNSNMCLFSGVCIISYSFKMVSIYMYNMFDQVVFMFLHDFKTSGDIYYKVINFHSPENICFITTSSDKYC